MVGLSLDGNKELHDLNRVDASGKGTFNRVTEAAKVLEKHKVDFNILTVVTNALARYPQAVYNEYKKRGYKYLQFIPALIRLICRTKGLILPLRPKGTEIS